MNVYLAERIKKLILHYVIGNWSRPSMSTYGNPAVKEIFANENDEIPSEIEYTFKVKGPLNGVCAFIGISDAVVVCGFRGGKPHGVMIVSVDGKWTISSQYCNGALFGSYCTHFRCAPELVSSQTIWTSEGWINVTLYNKEIQGDTQVATESVTRHITKNETIHTAMQYGYIVTHEQLRDIIIKRTTEIANPTVISVSDDDCSVVIKVPRNNFRLYQKMTPNRV